MDQADVGATIASAAASLLPANASAVAVRASAIAAVAVTSADEQGDWSRAGLFVIAALQLVLVLVAYRLDKAPAPALVSESAWAMFFGVIVRELALQFEQAADGNALLLTLGLMHVVWQFGAIIRFISPIVSDSHGASKAVRLFVCIVLRRSLYVWFVRSSNRSSTPWTQKCSFSRTHCVSVDCVTLRGLYYAL